MRRLCCTFATLSMLIATHAAADARVVVIAREPSGWTTAAVQARLGDPVVLGVALIDDDGVHAEAAIRIGPRVHRAVSPLPAGTSVRWLRVEPRRMHTTTPAPNPDIPSFSNAVLTGPRHGEWLGFDTLEYDTIALASSATIAIDGATVRVSAAHPTSAEYDVHDGAGSIWLAAIVTLPDGRVLSTPDGTSVDRFGLTREVMRISFRASDDYLGWLGTYFNVPNLFGSSGAHGDFQPDRYVGADCADVLVAGRRAMGQHFAYASVAGITTYATPISDAFEQTTSESIALRWGSDIQPGDLVTIGYENPGDDAELPRAWDHIGALVSDADGDGVLSIRDVVRHMSFDGLADDPLSAHGHVRLRVYRWRSAPRR
jgi:hypothetical protein